MMMRRGKGELAKSPNPSTFPGGAPFFFAMCGRGEKGEGGTWQKGEGSGRRRRKEGETKKVSFFYYLPEGERRKKSNRFLSQKCKKEEEGYDGKNLAARKEKEKGVNLRYCGLRKTKVLPTFIREKKGGRKTRRGPWKRRRRKDEHFTYFLESVTRIITFFFDVRSKRGGSRHSEAQSRGKKR